MKHGLQLEVRTGKRFGLGCDVIRYPKTVNLVAKFGTVHARLIVWPNGDAVDIALAMSGATVLTALAVCLVQVVGNVNL